MAKPVLVHPTLYGPRGRYCIHLDAWAVNKEGQVKLCEACADAVDAGAEVVRLLPPQRDVITILEGGGMMKVRITTTQVQGAWPNGSRVVKLEKISPVEVIPVGTVGTILGSMHAGSALAYCIQYDNFKMPVHNVYMPGRLSLLEGAVQ